ncbi:MAG TPA: ATP-binding protein, partial [Gemmataceae bacterium]|nr:ATP-binding protein [Gemmataceae bacterium]
KGHLMPLHAEEVVESPAKNGNGKPVARNPLGYVDWDDATASNERVIMRAPLANRDRIIRDQYVRIEDSLGSRSGFLGRIVAGPFFSAREGAPAHQDAGAAGEITILAEIELQGELIDGRPRVSKSRPMSQAEVQELTPAEVSNLLGFSGDMVLGAISGQENIWFRLQSKNKSVLPRNLGIFGTVGSGKSNTSQVVIEEAAANGWAVIVLDVESEYIEMDGPSAEKTLVRSLVHYDKRPVGLTDFQVYYPASCASERADSEPFSLRLADFDSSVIAEILQTSVSERNALLDCIEYLETRAKTKVATREAEGLKGLLDPSPQATLPYTLRSLKDRAGERSTRSSEFFDYTGLSAKLMWLLQSGAFDQPNMRSLDPERMLMPGRVSIFDVSVANDVIKNLVTADLLRKVFAYKIAREDAPPTLLVIEEAHSFISREKAQTMHATMQMLRNVARRGRKRWLSLAFVSQQPGHLPPEIFELCNTRIVHTLRSMHNLEVLMTTAGDVGREMWARCPLLGPGEAIVTSPQLKRPVVVTIRPAMSQRKFVR